MVELGTVCELVRGVTYSKKDEVNTDGHKILRANNIDLNGNLNLKEIKQIHKNYKTKPSQLLIKNDIFICLASGSKEHIGKVSFINKNTDYYFGGFMGCIRTNQKILPKYLFYLLTYYKFNKYLNTVISGANINNLSKNILYDYQIPFPPLEVQREVVTEIEGYQKIVDGAKQVVKHWKPTIKIDPSWPLVELGQVCQFNPKKSEIKKIAQNQLVSFVPMSDLNTHEINFKVKQEKKLKDVYSGYTYFAEGDVLLARVTPCFENGKSGIARNLKNKIGFGSSEFFIYRADKQKILPEMIYYFISSTAFIDSGKKHMSGTGGLQRLTKDYATKTKIPLPPLDKQKAIVAKIAEEHTHIEACKKLIKLNEEKIHQKITSIWEQK